jgi:acetyl-CoA carboxylase biotin carboxyl carrier protein
MSDLIKVKKLIEMLEASSLNELELETEEGRIRLVKQISSSVPVIQQIPQSVAAFEPQIQLAPEGPQALSINSPMVGTFYRSASPGGQPFVEIGKTFSKGNTLCIIEAMKMMNQVIAEVDGVITKVFIENGDSVEFDQLLFEYRVL